MSELHNKHCQVCEADGKALTRAQCQLWLPEIPLWQLNDDVTQLQRRFVFKGFLAAMAFANAIAWLAYQQNHHPDLQIGYGYCLVTFTTHAVSGLTENDFICAAKIDLL